MGRPGKQVQKKVNYPLVEVTWVDSSSTSGWQHEISVEPLTCYSAGYLIHRSRKSLVIAQNRGGENCNYRFGDTVTIPASCVKKTRRLK